MTRQHDGQVRQSAKPNAGETTNDYWQRRTTFGTHSSLSTASKLSARSGIHPVPPMQAPPLELARQEPVMHRATAKKVSSQGGGAQSDESRTSSVRAISGSGSGTIATSYTPEPTDQSTKIVFIQVMSESLDGVLVKPSVADASFNYQDADTTGNFQHVDYVSGEKDPYYNGDDPGDIGTQGNAATKVAASTTDTPSYSDGLFPPGKSRLLWDFRTAAFSAAGADAGKYYGYSDWSYLKVKGTAGKTSTKGTSVGGPGANFEGAVRLFNANHGFKMPGSGGLLGGIAGAVVLGAVGAVVGAALGGGVGAVVGGLAGAAAGAYLGSRKNDPGRGPGHAK
jgi:hypothetical protein